jgi:hypothetical protein
MCQVYLTKSKLIFYKSQINFTFRNFLLIEPLVFASLSDFAGGAGLRPIIFLTYKGRIV